MAAGLIVPVASEVAEAGARVPSPTVRVASLHVYPIKGCGGLDLERARLGPYGLDNDRHWMVVDEVERAGLTQRTLPAMARIRPRLAAGGDGEGGGLVLEADGTEPLAVPRPTRADTKATVWGWETPVGDAGEEAAAWLSSFLGRPCRLVAVAEGYSRPVNRRYDRRGREVGFADGYPLLLCTEASLADLNRVAGEAVPMDRFRPNLVIGGEVEPWVEDGWASLTVGGVALDVAKPCARCAVPQVDQSTGRRHKEPARALAAHRRGADGQTYFGINLVHVDIGAEVAVGDEVVAVAAERR